MVEFLARYLGTWYQCCGSMTFWGGSGSGSADPCLWLMDPESGSCYFRHWPSQDGNKNLSFKKAFLLITFWRYIYIIFKDKKSKRSQNRNQGFPYFFCLVIEGSRSGSGSIPLTDGSGSGSRRPKNMWIWWIRIRIRIRNSAWYPTLA
jgi:hypothetical protein